MNGGFQEFWDFDGTLAGSSNNDGNYNGVTRSGRAMVNNGRQRGWTSTNAYPQANYPSAGGNYLRGTTVWDCEDAPTAIDAASRAWNNNIATWSNNWVTGTGAQNITNEVKPTTNTFFALPPTGAAATAVGKGVKYWETTHSLNDGGDAGYSNGKTIQLMVATGLGHNATFLDPRGHNQGYIPGDPAWYSYPYVVELNPDQPSSLYQEIATVPGKIYEWSLDHAPREGRPASANIMAVVIGPAMNSFDDYESVGLTGTNNRWGLGDGNYTINGHTQYQGFTRFENYPYGSVAGTAGPTLARQTYFLDGVDNLGFTKGVEASYMTADKQSRVSKYPNNDNGRNYFVYIGAADKSVKGTYNNPRNSITGTTIAGGPFYEMNWTHHGGVYSVPEGQGISVFSFVGLMPTGSSGNILDNIVFKSGTPPTFNIDMFYSGDVTISAETRRDYVYGIAEVRGSSVSTFTENVTFTVAGGNPVSAAGNVLPSGDGIEHWYYFPDEVGTVTFSNMVPGKTYRIVGIPRGAVSGESQLNTNRTPALVLDDGYYEEVTIQGTSDGGEGQMSTVGTRDNLIFLTNSNPGVEYALLDADVEPGQPVRVVYPWRKGLGLGTGQSLFFENLDRPHCYLLVVRPSGWNEITYEVAANSEGAVRVCTSSVNDIQLAQVSRVHNNDGTDRIIIRQATDADENGNSAIGEHVIDDEKYEYRYYDGETGVIYNTPGTVKADANGMLYVEFGGEEFVSDGVYDHDIYHVIVREKREDGTFGSFLVGVRVYPAVPPYYIDYVQERIGYFDHNNQTAIPNARIQYRVHAQDANRTWLRGDNDNFVPAPAYILMGERPEGNPSLLDQMGDLGADATIESRYVDLWPEARFPSVFPLSEFEVPRRPAAPVADNCDHSIPTPDYTIDYPNEKITVLNGSLEYSTDNGGTFIPIPASQDDPNIKEESLGRMGWSGAEQIVPLRISASNADGHFASESKMQIILGRDPAPAEPFAKIVDVSNDSQIEILGLARERIYEYRLQGETDWRKPLVGPDVESIGPLELRHDSNDPNIEIDYEIRYAATCEKPASLYRVLSMPLSVIPINFGSVVYGYDPANLDPEIIIVKNVAEESVPITGITIENGFKDEIPYNNGIFELVQDFDSAGNNDKEVPGGGENRSFTIRLKDELPVGTYRATLRLDYEYENNTKITTTEIFVNVTKAARENTLEAEAFKVTDTSFGINISFINDIIPEDAVIEYSIDASTYFEGEIGIAVKDSVKITNLDPETPYRVYYRLKESENYRRSEENTLTVYTAYASDSVTYVNYEEEMLYMNSGLRAEHYEVKVNGTIVDMSYSLTDVADLGSITINMRRLSGNISNFPIPPSAPYEYTIAGRGIAPPDSAFVSAVVDGPKNTINLPGNFQYRRARRTNLWSTVSNSHTFERWGSYQIRYPAKPNEYKFASKYITIHVLPDLKPTDDGELYVNVDVDPLRSSGDGSSWENATPSLSAALEYARLEQLKVKDIYVATGTYVPTVSAAETEDERDYAFVLPANVTITGGYNVSPSGIVSNQSNNQSTILSGKLDDIAANAYHVVIAGNAHHTILNRLVITDGVADGTGNINIGSSNLPDGETHYQTILRRNGAGLYASGTSNLKLVNVLIHSNNAIDDGGGIYIEDESTVSLVNVTVSGNSAGHYGGGVYNSDTLSIGNTVIYGNTAVDGPEIYKDDDAGPSHGIFNATYSLVKDMALASDGEGNLDDGSNSTSDSLFLSPAINNFRLRQNSAAYNKGSSDAYTQVFTPESPSFAIPADSRGTDVTGKPREVDNIDMGAYEVQGIEIMTSDNGRLTDNAPVTGGTLIKIKATDYYDLLLSNMEIVLAGVSATVVPVVPAVPAVANPDRVGADGVIHCIAGVADWVVKGAIEINYKNNAGDAGRLIGNTAPGSFTYYPVIFIEDGKWSEFYRWEKQTSELILPYPDAKIQIKANCLQDIDVQVDNITVYPGSAYTIGSGKTLTANTFTLKDNASFLRNGGTMAVGVQNVEHTLSKGRNWYISNPVDMTPPNPGTLTVTNPANPGTSVTPDRIEKYNEAGKSWERVAVAEGLKTGLGHTIYSATTDMTVNFSGTYNDGNKQSPLLSSTSGDKRGFNLVGNPFPSYWTAEAANTANLYSTIWYRTNVGGVYEFWSYNASGNVGAAPGWEDATLTGSHSLGYVPPMQAFWVRVREGATPDTLTFADSNRTHADNGSNVMVRSVQAEETEETRPLLRLTVSNDLRTDETVIYADPAAKKDFDTYDSEKWFVNNGVEIFTLPASLSKELVINGLPAIKDGTEIPVGFRTDEGGSFRFHARELLNLGDMNVFLLDKLRDTEFDLRSGDYDFTASSVPVTDRFSIVFRSTEDISGSDGLTAYVDKDGNVVVTLYLKDQKGKNATVSAFDTSGRKVIEQEIVIGERTVLKNPLPRGVYMLRAGKYSTKVMVAVER